MKRHYSSRELAELLTVNESTVKRWADAGHIECVRTKGGHRRFPLPSVLKFVQESKMEIPELAARVLAAPDLRTNLVAGNTDVLVPNLRSAADAGGFSEALSILRAGLASKPDILSLFEDVVFPVLRQIGTDWAAGSITIDQEHLASQTIRDAIIRLQSSLHFNPQTGLKAVLACHDGQQHDIVLQCVAAFLQSKGWTVYNLGQSTPTASIVSSVKRYKPVLVVMSALTIEHEKKFLRDINQIIVRAAHRAGGKVVIGGPSFRSRFGRRMKADYLLDSLRDVENVVNAIPGA